MVRDEYAGSVTFKSSYLQGFLTSVQTTIPFIRATDVAQDSYGYILGTICIWWSRVQLQLMIETPTRSRLSFTLYRLPSYRYTSQRRGKSSRLDTHRKGEKLSNKVACALTDFVILVSCFRDD